MAIVQQYPLKTPKNSDLLVGTSIPDPNTNDDPKTSSFSISSIGSFLIAENNIITGGGTLNTIPLFTPDGQKIGDSIIFQNPGTITVDGGLGVTGNAGISGNLDVSLTSTFLGDVFLGEGLKDAADSYGTANQLLTSTGTQTSWQDFSTLVPNNITGSGTLNTIAMFTPDGTAVGDSIITQNALGTTITVNGGLTVDGSTTLNGALTVDDVATFTDEVECNNNVTVQGVFSADGNSVFSGGVTINDQLIDGEASTGTTGQILSSTGSSTVWIDAPSDPDAVVNTPDTYLSPKVRYIVSLTQGEYDAIVTPDVNTLYIII